MTYRVDAAVHDVQAATAYAVIDSPGSEAQLQELVPGHHAVLALSQPRNRRVRPRPAPWTFYFTVNGARVAHRWEVGVQNRTRGSGDVADLPGRCAVPVTMGLGRLSCRGRDPPSPRAITAG